MSQVAQETDARRGTAEGCVVDYRIVSAATIPVVRPMCAKPRRDLAQGIELGYRRGPTTARETAVKLDR